MFCIFLASHGLALKPANIFGPGLGGVLSKRMRSFESIGSMELQRTCEMPETSNRVLSGDSILASSNDYIDIQIHRLGI
jgi:hypothetical protein